LHNRLKTIEKWIIRLVVIQFIFLVVAQILMFHRSITPYLNKAVRHEGVIQPVKDIATESVDEPISMWYHN
jgi:uncharacterized protein YpmB